MYKIYLNLTGKRVSKNKEFFNINDALRYAQFWLGAYWSPDFDENLRKGEKVEYNSKGDTIEINKEILL